jgi:outer membrane protein TolC
MRTTLVLLLLLLARALAAQPLTLDSAIARALRNDRIRQQLADMDSVSAMQDKDLAKNWMPRLDLQLQSTWQNEQITIPVGIPGLVGPTVPLDFHRALLNFNQTIYDGSVTREKRQLAAIETDRQQLEAEAHTIDLKGQVIQRFMGVLLCAEQLRLNDMKAGAMEEQRLRVHNAVEAGAALPAEEDVLRGELVAAAQERIEVEAVEARLRGELALLMGDESVKQAEFVRPTMDAAAAVNAEQRPDIRAYDLRMQAMNSQLGLEKAGRRPTVGVFGGVGAGLPGYDIFNDGVRPMALVGINVQWRLLDWGHLSRQRSINELQRDMLVTQRDRVLRQVNIAITAQNEEVHKLDLLLEQDGQLVELRGNVTRMRSEQLAQGTATASDYISELNKETSARLGMEVHTLQRLLALRMRLNIAGQ